MNRSLLVIAYCLVAALAGRVSGQTAYPMLMSVKPIAVQQGTTAEVTVTSRYTMQGAYQVLLSGAGLSGEVIPPEIKEDKSGKKQPVEKLKVNVTAKEGAL